MRFRKWFQNETGFHFEKIHIEGLDRGFGNGVGKGFGNGFKMRLTSISRNYILKVWIEVSERVLEMVSKRDWLLFLNFQNETGK